MGSRISLICFLFLVSLAKNSFAQHLTPHFDPVEYGELLKLADRFGDTPWTKVKSEPPRDARLVYRSPEVGLVNRWDLWLRNKEVAIIVIRGTNGTATSWMENFYAGMIPAQGMLQLNDSTRFNYKLSADDRAYVHAGWMVGLAALAPDILRQVHDCYRQGIHEFIIFGHSQGGAIAFLLRSYLQYLDQLPKDIVWKTYCSAAPKPGNLYYAYDFDYITRDGWGLRVINPRDWVPETPFSIQTTRDFNTVNPFTDISGALKKQQWFLRQALRYTYGRLDRPAKRASRRMQRILGKMVYTRVRKVLPEYQRPDFVNSHNYTPAGTPVILYPVKGYDEKFPFDGKNIFIHHMLEPYRWSMEQIYPAAKDH
ncbi:lipase family protein [Chitinophaga nivalis]|uniref:Lipase family protein n=1 Tax=Chitinophaga nivalis TaxID=2991709 RepID=A0ABT3IQI0_9BACT|nr:lipase family protein [Chitinophaga nivalis]MCW3464085.1 lipase family protein [Chitinophaga nivalis]MCW3486225.1 lipase family protein [Chitinophaga nivalis]